VGWCHSTDSGRGICENDNQDVKIHSSVVDHKHWITKDIRRVNTGEIYGERWATMNVQIVEPSEIAELRRDGAIKLS